MIQTKRVTLYQADDLMAKVTYYPPHMRMTPHAHDNHQFSFLLAGSLTEETPQNSETRRMPSRGIKWAGQIHEDRYGPNGALIFSIALAPDAAESLRQQPLWRWEPLAPVVDRKNPREQLLRLLCKSPESERLDIIWDLIALPFGADDCAPQDACPQWLTCVLEELHEAPDTADLGQIAQIHGVHRGHLSRAFKNRFGVSPSQYRSHAQVMRGVVHMMEGQRPIQAAYGAGFADQSHFSRMVDRYLGITPGRLGAMLQPTG